MTSAPVKQPLPIPVMPMSDKNKKAESDEPKKPLRMWHGIEPELKNLYRIAHENGAMFRQPKHNGRLNAADTEKWKQEYAEDYQVFLKENGQKYIDSALNQQQEAIEKRE